MNGVGKSSWGEGDLLLLLLFTKKKPEIVMKVGEFRPDIVSKVGKSNHGQKLLWFSRGDDLWKSS